MPVREVTGLISWLCHLSGTVTTAILPALQTVCPIPSFSQINKLAVMVHGGSRRLLLPFQTGTHQRNGILSSNRYPLAIVTVLPPIMQLLSNIRPPHGIRAVSMSVSATAVFALWLKA